MYINSKTLEIFYTHSDIRKQHKDVSFSETITDDVLASLDIFPVTLTTAQYDSFNQVADQMPPVFVEANQRWETSWAVREMTAEEKEKAIKKLEKDIVNTVQKSLDDFARTRNYDGILSAATYATSTNITFQAEGQRAVQLRDDTWQTLYNILGEVATGGRVVTSYEDIEGDLPVLTWN